jgi:hypothetical protein
MNHELQKPAGEVSPPSNPSLAQPLPRRSVCAPAAMAFSFYRRPALERRNIMWPSSWLAKRQRSTTSGRSRAPSRPRPTSRPRLEALEDRWLPSQVSLTVSSLADSGPGTLRAAILSADAGKANDKFTISFTVTGTIDLQSPLPDLNNSITIQGPGASSLTVEPAAGASFVSAIVAVDAGQTASLSGLTIAKGTNGGIHNFGTLTVTNCAIVNNLVVSNDGSQSGEGGGIDSLGGTLTVSRTPFSGNSASFAGGIFSSGSTTISGCMVSGNSALGFDDPLTHNHIPGSGGGIAVFGSFTVSGCTFSGNSTDGAGGGMQASGLQGATVSNCTLCGNSAFWGGGIDQLAFTTISGCLLTGNTALGGGGGMRIGSRRSARDGVTTMQAKTGEILTIPVLRSQLRPLSKSLWTVREWYPSDVLAPCRRARPVVHASPPMHVIGRPTNCEANWRVVIG